MQRSQAPRGTRDILLNDALLLENIERVSRGVLRVAGYSEVRTPIFEHTEIFVRAAGEESDIVHKEMYTFTDRSERSLSLRPEGTAGTVRAYLSNGIDRWTKPVRLFYVGSMFRYERPQAGRYRQFHQVGAELFGSSSPRAELDSISAALCILRGCGLEGLTLELNTVGDAVSKESYRAVLQDFLFSHEAELCADCCRRAKDNPLRALDCKVPFDSKLYAEQAPKISEHLSAASRDHHQELCALLKDAGITYVHNPKLVRGLDYYNDTVFEIISDAASLGSQTTVCAGGRYDSLVQDFGGSPTPAFGWAIGVERLMLGVTQSEEVSPPTPFDVWVVFSPEDFKRANALVAKLRGLGVRAGLDYEARNQAKQFELARKYAVATAAFILTEDVRKVRIRSLNSTTADGRPVEMEVFEDDFCDSVSKLLRRRKSDQQSPHSLL